MSAIPAILSRLAEVGVSAAWCPSSGKAKFSADAEPAAEIVALIDAHKVEISEYLNPSAVPARREAHTGMIEGVKAARPPDVTDDRWKEAINGLEAFLVDGWGDEAEAAGWRHDELYAVPPLWAAIDRCGVALLIGSDRVVEVSAEAIVIETPSGARQRFYRKPRPEVLARITAWINAKLITWPQTHCLHCRLPINVGERFVDVAANDERARFHAACEPLWRAGQEEAARKALGIDL
jgi:hypothetical protein